MRLDLSVSPSATLQAENCLTKEPSASRQIGPSSTYWGQHTSSFRHPHPLEASRPRSPRPPKGVGGPGTATQASKTRRPLPLPGQKTMRSHCSTCPCPISWAIIAPSHCSFRSVSRPSLTCNPSPQCCFWHLQQSPFSAKRPLVIIHVDQPQPQAKQNTRSIRPNLIAVY